MKNKISASRFPIELLDNLVQIDHSCIEVETQKCHLVMSPFHVKNLKESIKDMLNLNIMKYRKKYDGILLNYKNMKILPTDSLINRDNVYVHINIQADFFIFKPQIGKVLMGTVNKKSKDHVGALIYNQFNVSLPKGDDTESWIGSKVKIGQEIALSITYINYQARLPYIKADLLSILSEQDSGISTEEEKERKPRKIKFDSDSEDEEKVEVKSHKIKFDSNSENEEEKIEIKPKVKLDNNSEDEIEVKKKKAKRKHKSKEEATDIKTEIVSQDQNMFIKTEIEDTNIEKPRKEKRHKKKHKDSTEAVVVKEEILSDESKSDCKKSKTSLSNNPLKSWDSDISLNISSLFASRQTDTSCAPNMDMADEEDKKTKRRSKVSLSFNSNIWDSKTLLPDSDVDEIFNSAGIKESVSHKLKKKRKRSDSDNFECSQSKKHRNI